MNQSQGSGGSDGMAAAGPTRDATPARRPLRLAARLVSAGQRQAINSALASGRVRRVESVDLLAPARLPALARQSLILLVASGAAFLALDLAARAAHPDAAPVASASPITIVGLVAGNLVLYIAILPLHEAVHAATILALGGRPRFGLRLPLALYCTAPYHIFTRAGYAAVALAPLVALSVAGATVIWLAPNAGAYLLFALAGNASGAVGDLASVTVLRRLPMGALIADTATGFDAFALDAPA